MAKLTNLGDLIDRSRDLEKVALIDLGGEVPGREYSFATIDTLANAVARGLLARGLERGDRVAILSANRAEYLIAYFGILRAGLLAVPINFKFPRQTIRFILRDCGAKFVFCDADRCADEVASACFGIEGGFERFLDRGRFEAVTPDADEPAMILYTSGSSGTPKGVVLSHQSHIWVVETRIGSQDLARHRYLIAAPLYHMNALALSQLACAAHATIVLLPQFAAQAYIEAIGRYRCTWLTAVPPMIAMMLREQELLARTDLSSVEFLRMGSAPVSASLMAAVHQALPKTQVTNAYGTTEAGPVVFGPHPQGIPQPELSVGYPHPKVQLRLVDGDNRDADQGVLEMNCPAVMLGYRNRPDTPSPITADGYYVTGDLFRRDAQGFHYFVGRTDDMFVSGGENIYPTDVERMLERHPHVAQACVVPIDDHIKGQKPVAFVVARPGRQPSEDEIKRFALANAPAYQHPRFVWFVTELPLASTNKIDRNALQTLAAQRRVSAEPGSQLPQGAEIFLDHVGHFVPDIEAARRALAAAGFAPTPVSVQTQPGDGGLTGTGNVTAMLKRGYVEVLFRTADAPLGRELDAAIGRHRGVHLVAFAVADAAGAHQRLGENGFRMRPLVELQREVDAEQSSARSSFPPPQGGREAPSIAAFTVARIEPGEMPEGRIQLLTHRTESLVWQPRWLSHPNGALGLTSVMIAVRDFDEAARRFARLTGRPARASALGATIDLDRGRVELVGADTLSRMLQIPIPSMPFIGAYAISVASLARIEENLRQASLVPRRHGHSLIAPFPPALGAGAWVFSEGGADPR
jgi:acyl-CoA synthetase (AMP-forming)/AMP-acid ligase II